MEIDNKELLKYYIDKDYDNFFAKAGEITDFLIKKKYYNLYEIKDDLIQDCLVSLWQKIVEGKLNLSKGGNNLMAFIWSNSSFVIRDYLKKVKRRESICHFFSYSEIFTENEILRLNGRMTSNVNIEDD